LYIFTSSLPFSLLLFTPFILPFRQIKTVIHVLPFYLQPSILSHSFLIYTVYQKTMQWLKKLISTVWQVAVLCYDISVYACVSAHLHVCPQLAPAQSDELYLYLLFKSLSIIGQCPVNMDILEPIGALQIPSHQNAKFPENSSHFQKFQ
jgi:hypothetical protein